MIFSCLQENLSKGLAIVTKAVPNKVSLPILSNILISAENGQLKLAATNLDTTIVTYIGASVQEEGSITIPAKLFKDFVTNLSPSTITAELKNSTLHVSSDKTKTKFNGMDSVDYPVLPDFPKDIPTLLLDPRVFAMAVSYLAFAAATDSARPVFTGIYLSYADGNLVMASSDTYRLSEISVPVEGDSEPFTTLLPSKTLYEISKIFLNSEEPVKFLINPNDSMAVFESLDTLVAAQILAGEYPNYKRIIPEEHIITAEFLSQDLLEAVRLTNIFSSDLNNAIKFVFDPKGHILITSISQETGEHESRIPAEITGELFEIAFNSKYLVDLLSNVKTERLHFKAKNNNAPCLFIPVETTGFLHVIAPVQIQD